jgi:3,5-epimerase/4-reductase
MQSIVIFGAQGYIGTYFGNKYPHAHTPRIDIGNKQAVAACLDELQPDVVINAAGRTGRPNVDWCESHKAETLYGNVTAPFVLLHECMERSLYLVQMSTGCMYTGGFDGDGFTEQDTPNFNGSFYSRTKFWLEDACKEFPVFLPRLRIPFDATTHERNVITKVAKYSKVLDQDNSMTYVPDLLHVIDGAIEQRLTGILNIVNPGVISPYKIMELYKQHVHPEHVFERIGADALDGITAAKRSNCKLSTAKLESLGFTLPTVHERMEEVMQQL